MKHQTTRNLLRAALLCGSIAIAGSSQAADIVKTNNTDNLNLGSSWIGGVAPGASDVAVWDNTVTSANTTLLGADLNWGGIRIADPAGAVTIGAGNALTLGASGIDMSAAAADLTLSNGVVPLGSSVQTWTVGSGRVLTVAGTLSRPTGGVVRFDTSAGGTINIASGTVSNQIPYAVVNDGTDFGATDASKNLVPGASTLIYTPNPDANPPSISAFLAGSTIFDVYQSSSADAYGIRLTGNMTPTGIRFNVPHPYLDHWTYEVDNRSSYVPGSGAMILVTPNVGTDNVVINSARGGTIRFNNTATSELILQQENTAGDLIFNNGTLSQQSGYFGYITKSGAGRVIFNTAVANAGPIRILKGTVVLNGASTATSAVSLNGGATLRGSGTVGNTLTVAGGGIVAAGNENGAGVLTVNGGLTFGAGASKVQFYAPAVPATNTAALLVVNGTGVSNAATVTVDVLSGTLTAGSYPLIRSTNGFTGGGTFALGSIKPHVSAYITNLSSTTLDLVVLSVNQPLTWTQGSGTWDLTSTNWQDTLAAATTYQEVGGLGDSVLFEDSLSGASPITVTINGSVTPSTVTLDSSKNFTFSGAGGIGGGTVVTKAGSGTLTLGTVNSFSGGLNLNGGTTVFSSLGNLGTGSISFDGGTLQYNGNTDDLSVRTVTFNTGGAIIDVGANTVAFANAVGNNGVGGLTKLGSGALTLNGTNLYSGDTLVSAGTLGLGYGVTLASSNIILSSGAAIEVVSGYELNAAANQTLSGAGGVSGGTLAVPSGTTISPGTASTLGTLVFSNYINLDISGTLELNATTSGSDLIVCDYVNINPGSVLTVPSPALTNGSYKLVQVNLGLSGSLVNFTFSLAQAGKSGELVLVDEGGGTNSIFLVVSDAATDDLTWSGTASAWDQAGTTDWYLTGSATPWAFTNGDVVRFDEVGSANPYVYLDGAVKPSLLVVSNPVTDYYFYENTAGSKISGAGSLLKQGAGKLTLATVNDNSGSTTVEGGTLEVSGSLGTGPVTNNAALVFSQSANDTVASIAGTGGLTQSGLSTLTVSGTADYTGPTTVSSGTLQFGTGGAAGVLFTSAITNNGTLILNSATDWNYSIPDTGTGILWKQGTNTLTLSGTSSRTGQTRVEAGKVILAGANQLQGSARIQAGGTMDINGFDQTFTGLAGSTYSGRLVNNSGTATNVVTINNSGTSDSAVVIADNDGTGGAIAVVKDGAGELLLRAASTYSGGTWISNGTINARTAGTLGTGPVNMTGGSLNLGATGSDLANTINLLAPSNTFYFNTIYFSGTLVGTNDLFMDWGAGNYTFRINGAANQLAGLTNTIHLKSTASGWLRFDKDNPADAVTFDLSDSFVTINCNGTHDIHLGALVGNTNTASVGDSEAITVFVGAKNLTSTFAGNLTGNFSWMKVGSGTQTMTGTNSTTGSLTVSNGMWALAGDATPTNMNSFRVMSGATLDVTGLGALNLGDVVAQSLSGSGTVNGAVTATGTAAATINPGDGIGTLTLANALTLAGNSVVNMQLNRTNSPATNDMIVASSITAAGTLNVTNLGPDLITGDKFQLFSGAVSGFIVNLPVSNALNTVEYVWTNKVDSDGSIELLSGASPVNTTPPPIISSYSGGVLSLNWPTNAGWTLQMQTNGLGTGLSNNWVDVPGSASITSTNITVDPASPTVFYRLYYTLP